jgi:hypothetical protein
MKTPETNDPLDALLRDNDSYRADDGFTVRVMASLPKRRKSWLRPAILLGSVMLGYALLILWLPSLTGMLVTKSGNGISLNLSGQSLLPLGALLAAGISLVWSAFAALRWED